MITMKHAFCVPGSVVFIGPEGRKKWYERKIDTLETIVGKVRSESDLLPNTTYHHYRLPIAALHKIMGT